MISRLRTFLVLGLLAACESSTGLDSDNLLSNPPAEGTLLSSDFVKTVLTPDGVLYSWGPGGSGALGQGDLKSQSKPTRVPGLDSVIDYDQDGGMAFALTHDGSVYQWGHYLLSSLSPSPAPTPTRAVGVANAVALFAQRWELYILDGEGALWRTSPSHSNPRSTPPPQRISHSKRVVQVSGAVGLNEDGTLFSLWESPPVDGGPVEHLEGIVAVQNNFERSVVLLADGTVWTWGHAQAGGLGDGIHSESSVPIQLPGLSGIQKISGRNQVWFALKEDGTVWYWGYRGRDENDQRLYQQVPAQVQGVTDAVDVAGHWEALIQTSGGDLYVFETETLELRQVPLK